jgi:uncharacterized protein (TIGR00661 family)
MKKKVLVAPLDWGLGHATRCIAVINELLNYPWEVLLAGSGDSLELLKKEFPSLKYYTLPGYNPRYPVTGSMIRKMALQLPSFISIIRQEHKIMNDIVLRNNIDIVISDNRYGCWSSKAISIFITHQSNILMPQRFGWLARIVRLLNERALQKFTQCWIPDYPEGKMAGKLISFGKINPAIRVVYVGSLSRFKRSQCVEKKYDVVAVCSGPEPQRTLLENLVTEQLKHSHLSYLIVRGVDSKTEDVNPNIVNFLTSEHLQTLLQSADIIVARSGYSTIMDLSALGKKAIFIPTPGQTEQEYLAKKLKSDGVAFYMDQKYFDLKVALEQSKSYSGFNILAENTLLKKAVEELLSIELKRS